MGIFSVELYLTHRNGTSVERLASTLGIDEDVLRERIEAARLCVEHQIGFI